MAVDYGLYEKLKPKLGEEEARLLLEHIDNSIEKKATPREDIYEFKAAIREDIHEFKAAVREEIQEFKSAIKEEIHRLELKIVNLEHRIDRLLYFMLFLFIIFNGDKVIALFSVLWKLIGK